jgi:hypothetical protein
LHSYRCTADPLSRFGTLFDFRFVLLVVVLLDSLASDRSTPSPYVDFDSEGSDVGSTGTGGGGGRKGELLLWCLGFGSPASDQVGGASSVDERVPVAGIAQTQDSTTEFIT